MLPREARAVISFRLLPGDEVDYVINRVKKLVDAPRVSVEPIGRPRAASAIADVDSEGFDIVATTIGESFPDAVMTPFLVMGGTDCRHYGRITATALRFGPFRATQENTKRVHGTNERVEIDNYNKIVDFTIS